MDDREIIALFWRRDETALHECAAKYGSRLRALAYGIVGDLQTAEECENDTYMAAWSAIPPHRPESYLYAFLARITRHISLNCCRDRSRLKRTAHLCQLTTELEQCIPAPDDIECRIDEMSLRQAINGFLGTLSAEKRNIFLRRYWYMDTIADIAKRFSVSESKVKTTLLRSRKQLREYLVKEGYML